VREMEGGNHRYLRRRPPDRGPRHDEDQCPEGGPEQEVQDDDSGVFSSEGKGLSVPFAEGENFVVEQKGEDSNSAQFGSAQVERGYCGFVNAVSSTGAV
jgi:hypothetical protein